MSEDKNSRREAYRQKLKDPRWQKKRLEVFQRDNFTCCYCGDWEETLHVHHLRYHKGFEPWDYDFSDLLTVCETCHSHESSQRGIIEQALLETLRDTGFSASDLQELIFTLGNAHFCCEKREFVEVFDWMMIEDQERIVREYYQTGIPSEWIKANPGLDGRPIPTDLDM